MNLGLSSYGPTVSGLDAQVTLPLLGSHGLVRLTHWPFGPILDSRDSTLVTSHNQSVSIVAMMWCQVGGSHVYGMYGFLLLIIDHGSPTYRLNVNVN